MRCPLGPGAAAIGVGSHTAVNATPIGPDWVVAKDSTTGAVSAVVPPNVVQVCRELWSVKVEVHCNRSA
jgi:hypothetical protein